jgi:D-alanine--poly(phosphoribitol) ligase subunit 1
VNAIYHYNLGFPFDAVAKAHADRPALRYPDRIHTYGELLLDAQRLGSLLLAKGCSRGDVVAIAHQKGYLSYALMVAALRLGIAYVNIDVGSPAPRLTSILATSRPRLLFCEDAQYADAMRELAREQGCELALAEDTLGLEMNEADHACQQEHMRLVDGSTIAYIMFTSGSTGVPKGVAVTHQNVLHFIQWGQGCFDVQPQDNFAQLSPMYFDNSVFDFYTGLFSGASLTPVHRDIMAKPYELVAYVEKMACSIWFSVPSLLMYLMTMKALRAGGLSSVRVFSFGGEGYPKAELVKLYRMFTPRARLVNVYGPTECTCICSAYELSDADFEDLGGLPALGRLNPNFDWRIADDDGTDADEGELLLIGPNVAAGYFNDPERTANSFFTLSEPERFGKRGYRTGDLVRLQAGDLHFVGRKDNQIKHMGYRIELEEIEHALVKLPQVDQAAVIYQRSHASYGKLVAFVACTTEIDERAILQELSALLPDYMVPSKLVVLPKLPFNPNGKVDRQGLRGMLGG